MSSAHWGALCALLCVVVLAFCQGPLVAQIDLYHEVSQDAFVDIVTFKCEHYEIPSDTMMSCAPFCPMLSGRHCFAFALDSAGCWICGEDMVGHVEPGDILDSSTFWVNSGRSRRRGMWFKSIDPGFCLVKKFYFPNLPLWFSVNLLNLGIGE